MLNLTTSNVSGMKPTSEYALLSSVLPFRMVVVANGDAERLSFPLAFCVQFGLDLLDYNCDQNTVCLNAFSLIVDIRRLSAQSFCIFAAILLKYPELRV